MTAYELRIIDWSSDVCSSDLGGEEGGDEHGVVVLVEELVGERRGTADGHDVAGADRAGDHVGAVALTEAPLDAGRDLVALGRPGLDLLHRREGLDVAGSAGDGAGGQGEEGATYGKRRQGRPGVGQDRTSTRLNSSH